MLWLHAAVPQGIVEEVAARLYRRLLRDEVTSGRLDAAASPAGVLQVLCERVRFSAEAAMEMHRQLYKQKLSSLAEKKVRCRARVPCRTAAWKLPWPAAEGVSTHASAASKQAPRRMHAAAAWMGARTTHAPVGMRLCGAWRCAAMPCAGTPWSSPFIPLLAEMHRAVSGPPTLHACMHSRLG